MTYLERTKRDDVDEHSCWRSSWTCWLLHHYIIQDFDDGDDDEYDDGDGDDGDDGSDDDGDNDWVNEQKHLRPSELGEPDTILVWFAAGA